MNSTGSQVYKAKYSGNGTMDINTEALSDGFYMAKVVSVTGAVRNVKVIKIQ